MASAHPSPCPDPSYRAVNPLEISDWDARLSRFPDATAFHTQGWARVLHGTYGFTPVYLVQQHDNIWTQLLPLMEVRSLFGSRRGVSLPFTDACPPLSFSLSPEREKVPEGRMRASPLPPTPFPLSAEREQAPEGRMNAPLLPPAAFSLSPEREKVPEGRMRASPLPPTAFSLSSEREKVPEGRMRVSPLPAGLSTLNDQLSAVARSRHWTHLELRPGIPSEPADPASVQYYNHVVPLYADEATQLDACESATRRSLRKAQSSGLRLTVDSDPANLDAYFRLHCQTRRRQGAPPQPMRFFSQIQEELLARQQGYVVLVWKEALPIAGAVFLHFGTRALYKFGASDLTHQELRPNQLALWTGFRHAAALGCQSVDLGRTSLHHEGLRRFKRGWGARETLHASYQIDLRTSELVPTPDRTAGWQSQVFRRLPVTLNRWIGSVLYRFAA